MEIVDVSFLDRENQPAFVFHSGDPLSIRLKVRASHPINDFVFGIAIFNADGVCCYGTNTYRQDMMPVRLAGEAEVIFAIESLDLSTAPTRSTSPFTGATGIRSTITGCCIRSV